MTGAKKTRVLSRLSGSITVVAFLIILTTISSGLSSTAQADSLASCISANPTYAGGFAAHGAYFEVDFHNNCQGADIGSVHATLSTGAGTSYQAFFMTYGFEQAMFDTFSTPPGNWNVSVRVSVDKDLSENTINLGSFYDSGSSANTFSSPSSSKQVCISAPGGKSQCLSAPNFYWAICSTNPNGILYSQAKNDWIKVWAISASKSSSCNPKFPFLVEVKGSTKQTSGSTNLKVIYSPYRTFGTYTQLLILKVK